MALTSLYGTEEPGTGMVDVNICTLEINIKYEIISSLVCSVCLSFGLIFTFFGFRFFKMVMFISGFMFGATAVPLLHHSEPLLDARLRSETRAGISLAVGVLCGLMTTLVSTLGLLLSGLQLGGLLSLATLVVVGQLHGLGPAWAPLVAVALAASLFAALLSLRWQKLFTVIYTSVLGAGTVTLCVDYLVGTFTLPDQVYDLFCQVAPSPLCRFDWVIVGIWPLLGLAGVLVQRGFTAKGASHKDAAHKKYKRNIKNHRYRESRRRYHRRCRPPPLKRYAGDVLAPSYLQSLQERRMETGSSTSSGSTITHTLIDFDFETGSMVSLTAASPVYTV
ncbi:transmembrane protein 198 [Gasterosteus aculeatus]|uniref:Transmembrane protein 198 n=1 Tax=Gasterosteus aculeatus aculeatus TaxID=481459 RepID=G3P978_GASAC|nr:transmembrane protein 198-like [Gasterosteus aculeatus aculeatus]